MDVLGSWAAFPSAAASSSSSTPHQQPSKNLKKADKNLPAKICFSITQTSRSVLFRRQNQRPFLLRPLPVTPTPMIFVVLRMHVEKQQQQQQQQPKNKQTKHTHTQKYTQNLPAESAPTSLKTRRSTLYRRQEQRPFLLCCDLFPRYNSDNFRTSHTHIKRLKKKKNYQYNLPAKSAPTSPRTWRSTLSVPQGRHLSLGWPRNWNSWLSKRRQLCRYRDEICVPLCWCCNDYPSCWR